MYNLLRVIAPPLGLGKKCPHRVAYKVWNFRDSLQHFPFWFCFFFTHPEVQTQTVQKRNCNETNPLPEKRNDWLTASFFPGCISSLSTPTPQLAGDRQLYETVNPPASLLPGLGGKCWGKAAQHLSTFSLYMHTGEKCHPKISRE